MKTVQFNIEGVYVDKVINVPTHLNASVEMPGITDEQICDQIIDRALSLARADEDTGLWNELSDLLTVAVDRGLDFEGMYLRDATMTVECV